MSRDVRQDDELGPVRWCGNCAEWWPDDKEFWYVRRWHAGTQTVALGRPYTRRTSGETHICRACHNEHTARNYAERRAGRAIPRPHVCRSRDCIVILPPGRDKCYGCLRRTVGPLTVARLWELGFIPPALPVAA